MGLIYLDCPRCGNNLDRTTKLVEGATVVRCGRCKRYAIERDTQWYEGESEEVVKALKLRWELLEKETPANREKAMRETSIHDPRWERVWP